VKPYKLYSIINIAGAVVCLLLIVLLFIFIEHKLLFGVLFRGSFSLLIIYNAVYLIFTDKPSFIIRKGREKHRKLEGIFLLFIGIFAFITALMGYGIS
jgi:uncharacterized membrane protein YfcA